MSRGRERRTIPIQSSDSLGKLMQRASPAQRAVLSEALAHYRDEFAGFERRSDINSESIAFSIHAVVDEHIEQLFREDPNSHRIVCARGCSHCCHLWVTIDRHEAALLLTIAREQGIEIDWPRAERQAAARPSTWADLSHADRACVFLGNMGECRVYEHRPNACRKYHAVDDASLCDTDKFPGGRVGTLVSAMAEVLASAALVAFPGATSMSRMLLKAGRQ